MALVLHLGGVGECGRLIWDWSVQAQESRDLQPPHCRLATHRATAAPSLLLSCRHHCPTATIAGAAASAAVLPPPMPCCSCRCQSRQLVFVVIVVTFIIIVSIAVATAAFS